VGRDHRDQSLVVVHTTRAALPAMKKNGWGRVINIASAHALVASPFQVGLTSREARHRRLYENGGARSRREGHHRQRDLSRLCAHAFS